MTISRKELSCNSLLIIQTLFIFTILEMNSFDIYNIYVYLILPCLTICVTMYCSLNIREEKKYSYFKYINKNEECPICYDKMKNKELIVKIQCSHLYHQKCINKWIMKRNNCPMCRANIKDILVNLYRTY